MCPYIVWGGVIWGGKSRASEPSGDDTENAFVELKKGGIWRTGTRSCYAVSDFFHNQILWLVDTV